MNIIFIPTTNQILENFLSLVSIKTNNRYKYIFIFINNLSFENKDKYNIKYLNLNTNLNNKLINISIIKYYYSLFYIIPLWKKYLNKINYNKNIIVIGNDCSPIIRKMLKIARKKGIKSILLQDGYLRSDAINGFWKVKESNIYNIVFKIILLLRKIGFNYLFNSYYGNSSDYIAVYGEYTKKIFLNSNLHKNKKIYIIGSPRHDKLLKYKRYSKIKKNNIIITYISFGGLDGKYGIIVKKAEINILLKIYKIIKNNKNIILLIRLRPNEIYSHKYNYINKKFNNIKIMFSDHKESILSVILKSDLIFSGPSTGLIDSIFLNKPSFQIYEDYFKNLYIPEIPLIKDINKLENIINNFLNNENFIFKIDKNKIKKVIINYDKNISSIKLFYNMISKIKHEI